MSNIHNKHQRKSIRLKGYDYRQEGVYFITICTYQKEQLFGVIQNSIMVSNSNGKIAEKYWKQIPAHFPNTKILEYIIMPNHLHGIIRLNGMKVGTRHAVSLHNMGIPYPNKTMGHAMSLHKNGYTLSLYNNGYALQYQYEQFGKPVKGSLSTIISSYKSAVTKCINGIHSSTAVKVWQSRFWEHIIRNEKSFFRICNYIRNNPAKWCDDGLNTS